jgi:hypothetical protein
MVIERPQDELRARPIVIVGIVGAVLVFAFIIALNALFLRVEESEVAEKTAGEAPSDLRLAENEQQALLTEYRWIDQEKGIVAVPIDRAIELMLEEAAKQGGVK